MTAKLRPLAILNLAILAALVLGSLAWAPPAMAQADCGESETVVRGDTLFKIATRCGTSVNALMRANPHIKDRRLIYPGQVVYMPGAILPGTDATDIYIVKKGDTLNKIATRFGTTVERLLELNTGITNPSVILEGQRISVPKSPAPIPVTGNTYVVQRGDTLRKIAAKFNTTVDALLKLNPEIKDPNKIYTGQRLTVPGTSDTYVVQRGDTLRAIANRFNTTVDNLLKLNPSIKDPNKIFVGQVLRIR